MKQVTVRAMRPTDLEAIVEIDKMVLGRERGEYWEMKTELAARRSAVANLVAEAEGKVVGFILGEASFWEYGIPDTTGYIDTIGVNPQFQHRGVASTLLREMVDHLRKVGVARIYTYVNWRDGDLLSFFSKTGFQRGDMVNLELNV